MDHEREKAEVAALYEGDLRSFFARFGLEEKFVAGQMKCKFCDKPVDTTNIYSILPESGSINVVCNVSECVTKFLNYSKEQKQ